MSSDPAEMKWKRINAKKNRKANFYYRKPKTRTALCSSCSQAIVCHTNACSEIVGPASSLLSKSLEQARYLNKGWIVCELRDWKWLPVNQTNTCPLCSQELTEIRHSALASFFVNRDRKCNLKTDLVLSPITANAVKL